MTCSRRPRPVPQPEQVHLYLYLFPLLRSGNRVQVSEQVEDLFPARNRSRPPAATFLDPDGVS